MHDEFTPSPEETERTKQAASTPPENVRGQEQESTVPMGEKPEETDVAMPKWLSKELGNLPQTETATGEKNGLTGESEVTQLRAMLADQQHRLDNFQRILQAHSEQERELQVQAEHERGGCLTGWIIFMGVSYAFAVLYLVFALSNLGLLGVFSLILDLAGLACVVALWRLKWWGYICMLWLNVVEIVLGLIEVANIANALSNSLGNSVNATSDPTPIISLLTVTVVVIPIISMVILSLLVQDRRKAFL